MSGNNNYSIRELPVIALAVGATLGISGLVAQIKSLPTSEQPLLLEQTLGYVAFNQGGEARQYEVMEQLLREHGFTTFADTLKLSPEFWYAIVEASC